MIKILYICDQNPFEHSFGAQQRSGLLLDVLCSKGQVEILCFTEKVESVQISKPNCTIKYFGGLSSANKPSKSAYFRKLLNLLYSFSPYSVYARDRKACKITFGLLSNNLYDYIVVRYIKNAFLCGLVNVREQRLIIDVDDLPAQSILSFVDTQKMSWFKNIQLRFYAFRAEIHTKHFLDKVDHSFFSNKEQCRFKNSSYLPNIPYPYQGKRLRFKNHWHNDNEFSILFVGFMHHAPNSEGVESFIENIWPAVKNAIPGATFNIAGEGVPRSLKVAWENHQGINVLGYIKDIAAEYQKCKAVVVPIYYGAGSNIKVLEAMSMGRACVISEFASRAFKGDLIDNHNILIANDSEDFSNKVIRILLDNKLNQMIASNGASLVEDKYNYTVFADYVSKFIKDPQKDKLKF